MVRFLRFEDGSDLSRELAMLKGFCSRFVNSDRPISPSTLPDA